MEGRNQVEIGFINLVATPHPAGVYPRSLAAVANKPIRFRGSDYAVVLPPKRSADDPLLWEGRLSIWTDIDATEPSIDKSTFEKKDVEEALKAIFQQRGFNHRTFSYVLDEHTHTLAIEVLNDLGKTISIKQAGKIFEKLFSGLNKEGQTYETTVIPSEDALGVVLGLKRIDRIKIVLKRPNPGDHDGGDADEVLRELHEQNIREADHVFVRQPGTEGIRLSEANQTKAEVAATNGYVESSGINDDGARQHPSTKEYPKIVKRSLAAGTSFVSALRNELKRFRGR